MNASIIVSISALLLVGCVSQQGRQSSATGASGSASKVERSAGQSNSSLSDLDQTFVKEAAQGSLTEVKMGHLGSQRAESRAVRELARRLVQDHSLANQDLNLMAAQKSITIPTGTSAEQGAMLTHLQAQQDAEFDQAFKQHAIQSHQQTIQKFETAIRQGSDADVKAFAQKILPVLRQHLKMAEAIPANGQTGQQGTPGSRRQNPELQQPNPQ